MAKRIFIEDNYLIIAENLDITDDKRNLLSNIYVEKNGTLFIFYRVSDNHIVESITYADILDRDGNSYESIAVFTDLMEKNTRKPSSLDVNVQRSTEPPIIIKATELIAETTTSALAVIDSHTIIVNDPTGSEVGEHLTIYSNINNRVSFYDIVAINTNTITVDSPIDFDYESGSFIQFSNHNLAVDGSATPRIFGVRNPTAQDVDLEVDFTRMILSMKLSSAGTYDKFGNITSLTNGLVCRFVDGYNQNIFNVKNNQEIDNLMYDFKFISATGNAPDGLSGRFTISNLGVVIRLRPFEDLQFIIQDDLTGIDSFEILLEGGIVKN